MERRLNETNNWIYVNIFWKKKENSAVLTTILLLMHKFDFFLKQKKISA